MPPPVEPWQVIQALTNIFSPATGSPAGAVDGAAALRSPPPQADRLRAKIRSRAVLTKSVLFIG
jgi:hypothetical protein